MARLQYPLSTLHEERCRPHARLVSGWLLAFAVGESNPVDRDERFQCYILILLSQACPGASWAHMRRYFFKSLSSDPPRAKQALGWMQTLFDIEREHATAPPDLRLHTRVRDSKPIVETFFAWCHEQAPLVLDETPIAKAIQYARNQQTALRRFLEDGRLPLHNNASENALRREALGRKNWLFVGTDEAGDVNASFVSLLASGQLHQIEPLGYMRDLLCLLPSWPKSRVLELSPLYWKTTMSRDDVQHRLRANVFRQVSLGTLLPNCTPQ